MSDVFPLITLHLLPVSNSSPLALLCLFAHHHSRVGTPKRSRVGGLDAEMVRTDRRRHVLPNFRSSCCVRGSREAKYVVFVVPHSRLLVPLCLQVEPSFDVPSADVHHPVIPLLLRSCAVFCRRSKIMRRLVKLYLSAMRMYLYALAMSFWSDIQMKFWSSE